MSRIAPEDLDATATMAWSRMASCSIDETDGEEQKKDHALKLDWFMHKIRILFTVRMFTAALMCLCFIALSITTSNLAGTMVCMFAPKPEAPMRVKRFMNESRAKQYFVEDLIGMLANETNEWKNESLLQTCEWSMITNAIDRYPAESDDGNALDTLQQHESRNLARRLSSQIEMRPCREEDPTLQWTSLQKGFVLAAQNAGAFLMLITGTVADRLNGKWTMIVALLTTIFSNMLVPFLAEYSIILVIGARILSGVSDALMTPTINSMITRWFPPKERPFAIGFITGGRQIGNLIILPVSGLFCSRTGAFGGWKPTYYVSAAAGGFILIVWLILAADKPSKHFCISSLENTYILRKTSNESLGKRKQRSAVPWRALLTSRPFIIGVLALVCHEYPLVIMLSLLPTYLNDVLGVAKAANGFLSALPLLCLWLTKTLSSSLSSYLSARKHGFCLLGRTPLVKIFNAIASAGLAVSLAIVPLLKNHDQIPLAIVALCSANAFAGLHTPGVQTALLQIAPAYTGVITGIAFSVVSITSIFNKVLNGFILDTATHGQWTILFEMSALVALLPVVFFSLWGSADLQPWAIPTIRHSARDDVKNISGDVDVQFTVLPKDLPQSSSNKHLRIQIE